MALDLDLRAAGPRARPRGSREHLGRGLVDVTAGRPLAAGAGRRPSGSPSSAALDAARARPRTSCRDVDDQPFASRASCTCRCRGTTRRPARRSSATCTACAPTRRGARGTSSSSAASTASTPSTTCTASCSTPSYLVLGLGDVYLGAPVATPLDPRHRLVTTKYNPARTWTPENAVGIGGAYLCIYGMEGPGGYQFVGRTVQVWNRDARGAALRPSRGCCGRSTSSAGTRSTPTSCSTMRAAQAAGELRIEIEDGDVPPAPTTSVPRRPRRRDRRVPRPRSRRRSPPSASVGASGELDDRVSDATSTRWGIADYRRCVRRRSRVAGDVRRGGARRLDAADRPCSSARRCDERPRPTRRRWPARTGDAAARRRAVRGEGQHRRRRRADHRRLPGLRLRPRPSTPPSSPRCAPPARSSSARPTSTSSPPASSAPARPYGTPPNAAAPDLIAGGSSSGSAVAVALGARAVRARHRHRRLRPGAGGAATASSGSSRRVGRVSTAGVVPGLPLARLRVGVRPHASPTPAAVADVSAAPTRPTRSASRRRRAPAALAAAGRCARSRGRPTSTLDAELRRRSTAPSSGSRRWVPRSCRSTCRAAARARRRCSTAARSSPSAPPPSARRSPRA